MEIEIDDSLDLTLFRPDTLYNNLETLARIRANLGVGNESTMEDIDDLIEMEIAYVTYETLMHTQAVADRFNDFLKDQARKNIKAVK